MHSEQNDDFVDQITVVNLSINLTDNSAQLHKLRAFSPFVFQPESRRIIILKIMRILQNSKNTISESNDPKLVSNDCLTK